MALTIEEKDFIAKALSCQRITLQQNAACRGDDEYARELITKVKNDIRIKADTAITRANRTKQQWGVS
jgi:hypothetical protein